MTTLEQLAKAREKFPKENVLVHKTTKCYFYHYDVVIQRLNETFGDLGWTYKIQVIGDPKDSSSIAIKCTLGILNDGDVPFLVERDQIVSPIFFRNTIADTLRSCANYGIVSCANLFGIGKELFDEGYIKELDQYFIDQEEEKGKLEVARAKLSELIAAKEISPDGAKEIACSLLKLDSKTFSFKDLTLEQVIKVGKFMNKGKDKGKE